MCSDRLTQSFNRHHVVIPNRQLSRTLPPPHVAIPDKYNYGITLCFVPTCGLNVLVSQYPKEGIHNIVDNVRVLPRMYTLYDEDEVVSHRHEAS